MKSGEIKINSHKLLKFEILRISLEILLSWGKYQGLEEE